MTRDLIRAGQLLKIEVLDHVILGRKTQEREKDFVSLRELGTFMREECLGPLPLTRAVNATTFKLNKQKVIVLRNVFIAVLLAAAVARAEKRKTRFFITPPKCRWMVYIFMWIWIRMGVLTITSQDSRWSAPIPISPRR